MQLLLYGVVREAFKGHNEDKVVEVTLDNSRRRVKVTRSTSTNVFGESCLTKCIQSSSLEL